MEITQEAINQITQIIKDECEPEKIILFGSCATGKHTPQSDIDIMILMPDELSRKEKLGLLFSLEKRFLRLKHSVDVILKSVKQFEEYNMFSGTVNYDVAKEGGCCGRETINTGALRLCDYILYHKLTIIDITKYEM